MAERQPTLDIATDDSEVDNSAIIDGLEFVPTLMKIKQLVLLRRSDLISLLNQFNKTLEEFTRDDIHYLRFSIIQHTDSKFFWKATMRINCSKICRTNNMVIDQMTMNLQQFLSVHQSLTQQINILQKCPEANLQNSANQSSDSSSFSSAKLSFTVPNDNECCICMDRQSNLVLPCTHRFCDQCFHQWSTQITAASSQTCPLCRVDVHGDSGFVLADMPKYDNIKKSLNQSILSLPTEFKNRNQSE